MKKSLVDTVSTLCTYKLSQLSWERIFPSFCVVITSCVDVYSCTLSIVACSMHKALVKLHVCQMVSLLTGSSFTCKKVGCQPGCQLEKLNKVSVSGTCTCTRSFLWLPHCAMRTEVLRPFVLQLGLISLVVEV